MIIISHYIIINIFLLLLLPIDLIDQGYYHLFYNFNDDLDES